MGQGLFLEIFWLRRPGTRGCLGGRAQGTQHTPQKNSPASWRRHFGEEEAPRERPQAQRRRAYLRAGRGKVAPSQHGPETEPTGTQPGLRLCSHFSQKRHEFVPKTPKKAPIGVQTLHAPEMWMLSISHGHPCSSSPLIN